MKKAIDIKQANDQDLYVDILAADRDHIDRAKAKAKRVQAEAQKAAQARRRAAAAEAKATRRMEVTASLAVCAVGVWTFLAAMLA